jgi:hypothetical protein
MAFYTRSEIQQLGLRAASGKNKTASALLKEEIITYDSDYAKYDVFLSHSIRDAGLILGIKSLLTSQGLKVYVDWIEDPSLDRSVVTAKTAETLRKRMRQSKSMVYAHSNNSPLSKWMPWEVGFFDGFNGNIVIFPIVDSENETFKGQEFLGLYPYIDKSGSAIWVNKGNAPMSSIGQTASNDEFKRLKDWMREKAGVSF